MPRPQLHRDTLVEQGLRLFYARGFHSVGISEILEATGAPKGSFYHHFEDKGDFGLAVLQRYFDLHMEFMARFLKPDSATPKQDIEAYFGALIRKFRRNGFTQGCMLGNFTVELADTDQLWRDRLELMFDEWASGLAEAIGRAQRLGEVRGSTSSLNLARFIISSWEGALLQSRATHSGSALEAFQEGIFNQVLA
jgi:TetR/AcrR family transcriptional regulator, transcriptional repressor for nem operon